MLNILAAFPPEAVRNMRSTRPRKPAWFLTLSTIVFFLMFVLYKWWTRPIIFWTIFGLFLIGYFGSIDDPNFRSIVAKPDNVPITMMVISVVLCIWLASAPRRHQRHAHGGRPAAERRRSRTTRCSSGPTWSTRS